MSDPERPVDCAVEVFKAGLVDRLLFTGGYNSRLGRAEAHAMSDLALQRGVPAEAILIEDQARHTDENIRLSYRLMKERMEPDQIGSVMLMTIQYHLRRAQIAASRCFGADVDLSWKSYPSLHYTASNWFEAPRGRDDISAEIDKIQRYYGLTLDDLLRKGA